MSSTTLLLIDRLNITHHSGWCPKGGKAEDGTIPVQYLLQETRSADYLVRTEKNVVDADATIIFTLGRAAGGSLRTIEFAHAHQKPWMHVDVDLPRERIVKMVVDWLEGRGDYDHDEYQAQPPGNCVLNVAGTRESKADGIQDLVMAIMVDVLIAVNPECKGLYPLVG
jgi:hypothetical protein